MASPQVLQAQLLRSVLRDSLDTWRPASVAVLGCAAGNGFEHLTGGSVERVIAIDINPQYLEILEERYLGAVPGLETVCGDIAAIELEPGSVDLLSCALVLEYVEPEAVLSKAACWLRRGGILSVLVQLPSGGLEEVTPTEYGSLRALEGFMRLVDPDELDRLAAGLGLEKIAAEGIRLETGKEFRLVEYRRP